MIREQIAVSNENSGALASHKMEIGDPGLIMDIIRSKLYSDPIGSVCREILSNAYDAHVEAGKKEVPIEITVPTPLDNNLIIKDFGKGIDPYRMETFYTKYGVSTKTDSNDQVGGFGIGRAAAWAYASQFTVISTTKITTTHDLNFLNKNLSANYTLDEVAGKHIQAIYVPHLSEDNMGAVKLLAVSLTDEPTGLGFYLAIESNDIKTFETNLVKFTKYWSVKPKFINFEAKYPYEQPIYTGSNWEIVKPEQIKNHYGFRSSGPRGGIAIIGNVPYPIDLAKLDEFREKEVLSQQSFNFNFDIGEIAVSASREQIYYNDKTKKILTERIKTCISEVETKINDEVKESKTYLDAVKVADEASKILGNRINFNWRGNRIHQSLNLCANNEFKIKQLDTHYSSDFVLHTVNTCYPTVNNKTLYIINDLTKTVKRDFVKNVMRDKPDYSYVVISFEHDSPTFFNQFKEYFKKKFEFDFENLPHVKMSNYKAATIKAARKTDEEVFLLKHFSREKLRLDILEYSGYYVSHANGINQGSFNTQVNGKTIDLSSHHVHNIIKKYNIQVVSLTAKQLGKVTNKAKHLGDLIQEKISELVNKNPILSSEYGVHLCELNEHGRNLFILARSYLTGDLKQEILKLESIFKLKTELENLSNGSQKNFDLTTNSKPDLNYNLILKFIDKCKLLFILNYYNLDDKKNEVAIREYLDLTTCGLYDGLSTH